MDKKSDPLFYGFAILLVLLHLVVFLVVWLTRHSEPGTWTYELFQRVG